MPDRVLIRVPATVANLGPGFDCIGMAIAWHNEVRVERVDSGETSVTGTGPGADDMPRDATNLVLRGIQAMGVPLQGLRVNQIIGIPPGRGFGSSASAICAGLVAARALAGGHDDLLDRAIEIEGHADNVAPCLRGGITVSSGARTIRLDPPPGLRPLLLVSPNRLPTEVARAALGETVPRKDAATTLARAALLTAAIATADLAALFDATDDVFHQPVRSGLMPDSGTLIRSLRAQGIAAFLSGAGPSVAALVTDDAAETVARSLAPDGWEVRLERFDLSGATVADVR